MIQWLFPLKHTALLLVLEDLISVPTHYTVVTPGGWSILQTIY